MIILDTNILSELLNPISSVQVLNWLSAQDPATVFTTAITKAELLSGAELLPPGKRRSNLLISIYRVLGEHFSGKILPFDELAAVEYSAILSRNKHLGRPIGTLDAMIAAIAATRDATLATRNIKDFQHCKIRLINPWKP